MKNLNSLILEGNCVRDPELFTTSKGTVICKFSIANNRYYKVGDKFEQEVSFFDVEVWGKLATITANYCSKGRGLRIVGRLKQSRWEDKDGKTCSKVRIVAEHVEFKPLFIGSEKNTPKERKEATTENPQNFAVENDLVPASSLTTAEAIPTF